MKFLKGLGIAILVLLIIAFALFVAIYITAVVKNDTIVNIATNWWTAIKDWFVSLFSSQPTTLV